MGDKISSRTAAARAGVTPVPGTDTPFRAEEVVELRERLRVARGHQGGLRRRRPGHAGGGLGGRGGGGSGIGATRGREGFRAAECYVEKYLTWPRHVEVQVFGDNHGNVVHLGTRDCSVQRRHQKLVEEAPAPGLPGPVAAAMGKPPSASPGPAGTSTPGP